MGIEQLVRSKIVHESGFRFIDGAGNTKAFLEANRTGHGMQNAVAEFEIMRSDLCQILYDLVKDKAKFVFGVHVAEIQQDDDSVLVRFSDGTEGTYDLVVGADGQNSKTRRMLLGADASRAFKSLGVHTCYFTIPQEAGDSDAATVYHAPRKRLVLTRKDNPRTLQVYLGVAAAAIPEPLRESLKGGVSDQKKVYGELYKDAGWQSSRIIAGMREADDFYYHEITQIKLDAWSRGRVVLLGDAAYCPSPVTGMGTSAALVGAYVLAGEISTHCAPGSSPDGLATALAAYCDRFSPFVRKVQRGAPTTVRMAYPETQWGIWLLHLIAYLAILLRIDKLFSKFGSDDVAGWDLPQYPKLEG